MQYLRNGMIFFLISFTSCATMGCDPEKAPKVERCIWNDDGTAECLQADGETFISRSAKELENYIGTNPDDYRRTVEWCAEGRE